MLLETLIIFIVIFCTGFLCEWIDSALGMGYGTILSPLLIIMGYPVNIVVPSILITQAVGGFAASLSHHHFGNANFNLKSKSDDLKTVTAITSLGVIATIISTIVAINISKRVLTTYISILVILMGALILLGYTFRYSLKKMVLVGIISSFNKGLSGGGFGPIVTGGQMVLGQEHKKSIACTTAAEPLICITGFLSYMFLKGISDWSLIYSLGAGALISGLLGPGTTAMIGKNLIKKIVAIIMLALGILSLLAVYNLIGLKISM